MQVIWNPDNHVMEVRRTVQASGIERSEPKSVGVGGEAGRGERRQIAICQRV